MFSGPRLLSDCNSVEQGLFFNAEMDLGSAPSPTSGVWGLGVLTLGSLMSLVRYELEIFLQLWHLDSSGKTDVVSGT